MVNMGRDDLVLSTHAITERLLASSTASEHLLAPLKEGRGYLDSDRRHPRLQGCRPLKLLQPANDCSSLAPVASFTGESAARARSELWGTAA